MVSSFLGLGLLLFGSFLILAVVLTAGGIKEMHGWLYVGLIMGILLAIAGIIIAIIGMRQDNYIEKTDSPSLISSEPINSSMSSMSSMSSTVDTPSDVTEMTSTSSMSPMSSTSSTTSTVSSNFKGEQMYSPIGTPTKTSINVPQAQRGFSTTGIEISSLAP